MTTPAAVRTLARRVVGVLALPRDWFALRPVNDLEASSASRHPFQIWVMFACCLGGLGQIASINDDNSVHALLPDFAVQIWAATMLASAITVFVGIFMRDRVYGLLVERLGMLGLGFALAVYGVALVAVAGWASAIVTPLLFGLAMACRRRVKDITERLGMVQDWRKEHLE